MSLSHAEASASISPIKAISAFNGFNIPFTFPMDFIAPTLINEVLSGQFPVESTEDYKLRNTTHVPGQKAPHAESAHPTYASWDMKAHSQLHKQTADEDRRMRQAGFDPEQVNLRRIAGKKLAMMIDECSALYTLVSTTGNYESSTQYPAAATAWSSVDTADGIADLHGVISAVDYLRGFRPNRLCLARKGFDYLRRQASTLARLGSDKYKYATPDDIRMLLDIEEILIVNAKYDSAATGVTTSSADLWGAIALAFYMPPGLSEGELNGQEFARTLRDVREPTVHIKDITELDPGPYAYEYTIKAGYYAQKMININSGSDADSLSGGIVTGLY